MTSNKTFLEFGKRNNGIDFLRGLSILLVILFHVYIRVPIDHTSLGELLPPQVINTLFKSGYYGVIIFFVISGFLITTSSIKKWGNLQNIRYDQFYLIRFARIVPCLIALLVILSFLHLVGMKDFVIQTTSLKHAVFSALTFHINWLEAKTGYLPGAWDVLWSLSVEEVFYLFFPLLCIWIRSEALFIAMMLVFVVLGPFARVAFSSNDIWMDHSYLSCMDGIALGCLAALLVSKININQMKPLLFLIIGLLFFLFIFVFRKQAYHMGLTSIGLNVTILELSIALMLIALQGWFIQRKSFDNKFTTVFRWFGKNSYEVYLIHMFIVTFVVQIFYNASQPGYLFVLWYFLILIISGMLGDQVAKYYSEPMNKLLRIKLTRDFKLVNATS